MAGPPDPVDEAERQWAEHGWADAAPGMAAVTRVVRLNQLLMAQVDAALRPHGLTFARFEVLRLLAFTRTGRLPMGRLGSLLQVRPASVSNVVERLEAQGLVERHANPDDGRSTVAHILPAGRRRLGPATDDLNDLFTALAGQPGFTRFAASLRSMVRRGDASGPA